MDGDFMQKLLTFRVWWARPMRRTSFFRCLKYNAELGSKPDSQHVLGKAGDILVASHERHEFVKLAFKAGFTGIGVAETFIHLDTRDKAPALWIY